MCELAQVLNKQKVCPFKIQQTPLDFWNSSQATPLS